MYVRAHIYVHLYVSDILHFRVVHTNVKLTYVHNSCIYYIHTYTCTYALNVTSKSVYYDALGVQTTKNMGTVTFLLKMFKLP